MKESGSKDLQVGVPSVSIRADNPVAWVDRSVAKHHTEPVAKGYLEYLFSDVGQELAAKHNFRPQNTNILARFATQFKPIELFTVEEIAGSWRQAQQKHFGDGALFDQLYQSRK